MNRETKGKAVSRNWSCALKSVDGMFGKQLSVPLLRRGERGLVVCAVSKHHNVPLLVNCFLLMWIFIDTHKKGGI